MHNIIVKNAAKKMRLQGGTVRDIAKKLNLSFSIVSFWCRDIKLSDSLIEKMKFQKKERSIKGLLKYSELKRDQRIKNTVLQKKDGMKIVGDLSKRDMLMVGLGLYWGEGYKESNGEMGFTNSSPIMMRFYINWLISVHKVLKEDMIFKLSLNEIFKGQEKDIKKFWISYLDIKEDQFTKTTFIKTFLKKAFIKKGSDYKGILRVKVKRGLTLKNKVLGAIEYIANFEKV